MPRCHLGAAGKVYENGGIGFLDGSVQKWKAAGLSADAFSLCASTSGWFMRTAVEILTE